MRNWKVDYSELVDALRENDKRITAQHLNELHPRLVTYLIVTMDASPRDAEDAVQQAFLNTYKKLIEGNLKVKKFFFKYLLQACRGEYLKFIDLNASKDIPRSSFDMHLVEPEEQIKKLVDEERRELLKICMESLQENYRLILNFYCRQSKWSSQAAAARFDTTDVNARMIKSRAIKKLTECVKRKLGEKR